MEGTNKEIYERGVARREKIENDVEYVIKDRRAFDNIAFEIRVRFVSTNVDRLTSI